MKPKRGYQIYKTTIPAGATESFNVLGNAFYLIRSTDKVQIKNNETTFSEYVEKQGITAEDGFEFNRIEAFNRNAFAITIVLWAGYGKFEDARSFQFDAQTEAVGSNIVTIANAASLIYPGTPNGDRIQRRDITIANNSLASFLNLVDKNGNAYGSIPPASSYIWTTGDSVTIENASGGTVDCRIGENWYII